MKKLLFIFLAYVAMTITANAQSISIDDFCMPQLRSSEEAAQYVGKKVKVFYRQAKDPKWKDTYKFDEYFYGRIDDVYTISKIKVGKQIILHLVSENGYKYKVPVNYDGAVNYDGLSSCNIFFVIDKFNKEKQNHIGKIFKNSQGEDVATLEDISIATAFEEVPKFIYTLRSKIDNETFKLEAKDAEDYCMNLGVVMSHPLVKTKYRAIGGSNYIASDFFFTQYYEVEDINTGETRRISYEDINKLFDADLAGKYVSLLSNVEKPSNPEIRYGETTTIPSEDAISKFVYKDNIIDIMIFGVRDGFNFVLQNISGSTIKIIWDEAVFVNFDGSTEKVMHKGTKYAERNESQPATTIIKNAKWDDVVTPTNLVYYDEGSKYIKAGWRTHSLYPTEKALEPGQIMLMLPIQIKEVINEYIFVFDVKYVYEHPERLNLPLE